MMAMGSWEEGQSCSSGGGRDAEGLRPRVGANLRREQDSGELYQEEEGGGHTQVSRNHSVILRRVGSLVMTGSREASWWLEIRKYPGVDPGSGSLS